MYKKLILLSSLLLFSNIIQADDSAASIPEIPMLALKLLADSTIDPCPICAEKLKVQAFKTLNETYKANLILKSDASCRFVKSDECGDNEFVSTCYKKREEYKTDPENGKVFFPLILFKFHTVDKHLIGIGQENFSDIKQSTLFNKIMKGSEFSGEISLINFKYGDGPTYKFNAKENILTIHCKINFIEQH